MSERIVQTVTPRQLRREFNGIGLTFLIVFGLAVGAAFGYRWLTPLLEPYYQTVDRQAAEMGIRIVVTLLVMLLPFQIYAALKKMKTGRFFGHCQGEWRDILGLVLIGLAPGRDELGGQRRVPVSHKPYQGHHHQKSFHICILFDLFSGKSRGNRQQQHK